MKNIISFIIIFFAVLRLNSANSYRDAGSSLNKEGSNHLNFQERFLIFQSLLGELLSDNSINGTRVFKYLVKSEKLFISGKGHMFLKNAGKDEEFFRYFDLAFFNIMDFKYKAEQGKDMNLIWPCLQPRLTKSFLDAIQGNTSRNNFMIRRAFIIDFSMTNIFPKLSAFEKLRMHTYIQRRLNIINPNKLREEFENTDIILRMLLPYLKFSDNDMMADLFEFNIKPYGSVEKEQAASPKQESQAMEIKKEYKKKPEINEYPPVPIRNKFWFIIIPGILFLILMIIIILILNKPYTKKAGEEEIRAKTTASGKTPFDDNDMTSPVSAVAPTKVDAVSQMMISTLPKRYEKIWKISKGGMGIVFGAQDKLLKRRVAIKMILPSLCDDESIIQRFIQEARSVAALDHPNILKIFDVGGDQYPFFVMEYLEGISLENIIDRKKKMTNEEMKFYGIQMADAFRYCHEKGIIHRDIKPANIIVVNNFRLVKVVDFGIAKDPNRTGLTQMNISIGSPQYMAPEQIKENKCGVQSDIYSFGLTLYRMASGALPFEGTDVLSRLNMLPKPVLSFSPEINRLLASLIMKCIEREPKARFENFDQIRNILIKLKM